MVGQESEKKGRKKMEGRRWQGKEGPLRLRITASLFYPSPPLELIMT